VENLKIEKLEKKIRQIRQIKYSAVSPFFFINFIQKLARPSQKEMVYKDKVWEKCFVSQLVLSSPRSSPPNKNVCPVDYLRCDPLHRLQLG
jgi:hypothetical protein